MERGDRKEGGDMEERMMREEESEERMRDIRAGGDRDR